MTTSRDHGGGGVPLGRASRSDELQALAARCEREEPSRELDVAIWHTLRSSVVLPMALPWTSGLDAAVTLVPEGMAWTAGCEPDFTPFARLWEHDLVWAATPALALCAAALRARAALEA